MTKIIHTLAELRALVSQWRQAGEVIGVVPTMGALHAGHMSLAQAARQGCDRVIVTVFVNPIQFNNAEDLAKYPRTLEQDAALLAQIPVDVVFAPNVDEMYPEGFVSKVAVGGVSEPLEGEMRPGHFDGVATVVSKIFGMTQADRAYFGQKDWQQLQVIRRLVRDLNFAVEVVGCETLREADGLALSSRNQRLSAAQRAIAPALYREMQILAAALRSGASEAEGLTQFNAAVLAAGFNSVEYIELRDAYSLMPVQDPSQPLRMLVAAWLGDVRLIDNIAV